jgi:hypothetical protein
MTDVAVNNTTDSLEFSVIAVDTQRQEHVVVSQILLPGDKAICDKHSKFDYDVKNIKFVHYGQTEQ